MSGIADSKSVAGFLWVEQDGGNPPELLLLSYNGILDKRIPIRNIQNRDWEDMVIAPGPDAGKNYIYLADIGDNNLQYTTYFIYRFHEPSPTIDTVFAVEKITFQYPDGSHDAEAILVDPTTKDIYIITKRDATSKVYKMAYPQSTGSLNTGVLIGSLPFSGAVSAALSPDSKEIIIKTYPGLFYWKRQAGENIETVLTKAPITLAYTIEPQGEAICFKNDNTGFYSLSERGFATSVNLNFYKRK